MLKRAIVVSNDVVPGLGVPVAAPGLRAWGIAEGLRGHGFDVTLTIPKHLADRAWERMGDDFVPPVPSGSVILPDPALPKFLKKHAPAVVVMTNSNRMGSLRRDNDLKIVYDFFAPKMLELALTAWPRPTQRELSYIRSRKIYGINLSDGFIVNGAKKLPYVYAWLLQGERPIENVPVEIVNMPSEPFFAESGSDARRLSIVMAGYLQHWMRLGKSLGALRQALDAIPAAQLTLVGQSRWDGERHPEADALKMLAAHPSSRSVGHMLVEDFRELLATKDLFIDLFEPTPERELAMVTRTVVAIGCGLPVVHPSFTEVSPLIAKYDAGWLIDANDSGTLVALLKHVASDPAELAEKRANARRLAQEVFASQEAVKPLIGMIEEFK